MDNIDAISYLAQAEARRFRPIRDTSEVLELAEAGRALPYIEVTRSQEGRLVARGYGHEGHDNEPRMAFMCDFFERKVLPMVDPDVDVKGVYRIELHDSYSYLAAGTREAHANSLGFARPQGVRDGVATIPDPYHIADFGGILSIPDNVPWSSKMPLMFFAGSTTGAKTPAENERIRACVWSLEHRSVAHFLVTNIVQMDPATALRDVPSLKYALHAPVAVQDHFNYKYQVNIAGNTACWSRVPMILASSCLMFNLRQQDVMWYYPALRDGDHFLGADDFDDLLQKRAFCTQNDKTCQRIVANANSFVENFLRPRHATSYTVQLLENAAYLNT